MLESQLKSQQQGDSDEIVWVERRTKKKTTHNKIIEIIRKIG